MKPLGQTSIKYIKYIIKFFEKLLLKIYHICYYLSDVNRLNKNINIIINLNNL